MRYLSFSESRFVVAHFRRTNRKSWTSFSSRSSRASASTRFAFSLGCTQLYSVLAEQPTTPATAIQVALKEGYSCRLHATIVTAFSRSASEKGLPTFLKSQTSLTLIGSSCFYASAKSCCAQTQYSIIDYSFLDYTILTCILRRFDLEDARWISQSKQTTTKPSSHF